MRLAYFDVLDHALAEAGVRNRLELTDTGYNGVAEVISGGMAFCISILAPENPIHGYQLENVTVLPFTDFHPRLETALVWRRDRADSDLKNLVAAAREIFDELLTVE